MCWSMAALHTEMARRPAHTPAAPSVAAPGPVQPAAAAAHLLATGLGPNKREDKRMKRNWLLASAALGLLALSGLASAQTYPQILIPPAKGPFTFAKGYQIPWDKIQIAVTEKIAPNIFLLHGSPRLDTAHPDASGGRIAVLFGPDGVLMVDSEDVQLAEKSLKIIRGFTNAPIRIMVNSHIHPDHTGGNAFFAKQGAMIFSQENLREEMLNPPLRGNGQPAPAADPAGVPVGTYKYDPTRPGEPAMTIHMD